MDKNDFFKQIDVRENLEFRYKSLLKKFKDLGKLIAEKSNIKLQSEIFINEIWNEIASNYPEKREKIMEGIQIIYSDEILTQHNLNKLEEIYKELSIIID